MKNFIAASIIVIASFTATPADAAVTQSNQTAVSTDDRTTNYRARTSRSYRGSIGASAWAKSPTARRVAYRESRNNCRIVSPSGKYRGKWQMDSNFWRSYGGLKYASTPDRASCYHQDIVAYRGWVARWWQPWTTY